MNPIGDVYEARSKDELNDSVSPMKNRQDDSTSPPGSHRFVKSTRREEETINPNYDSDSSSKNTTRSNLIQNTDQQQADLLRKLDSLKGNLLIGDDNTQDLDQPPMGFYGHVPAYYNPYPEPFPHGMYPSPSHVPAPYGFPIQSRPQNWHPGQILPPPPPPFPQGHYVDIGPDILDPRFLSQYGHVPYSPVFHHVDKTGPFSHYTRWTSEIDSEMSGAETRRCHPLAGGAPFIACHNCFELLHWPKKKLLAPQEKQQKLQCGACSEVMSFAIIDTKLVFSSPALEETTNLVSVEVEDKNARTAVIDDCPLEASLHRETKIVQALSPSQHSDDEERSSIYTEPQKQVVKSVQDSLKPESVPTETDVSNNVDYNNIQVSEDAMISKTSKEESRPKNRKESNETISNKQNVEMLEVWVNGHLIPEDLVISAEKLAGSVKAGKYWYDYRAGFWGVMGNPCLGMIPPFIEEFNRPMPDKCSAGNTSVFVNGRELHERDLELLSSRGLSKDKNRSYIIDISGRVLDGDSGEELKSLGKLAPTIDKVRRGFGMRVPRSLVS